ncbi:unnamed protein product [Cyprideis torosa]|uniref:Uncharacterized protein n=1 Tax=Cyprideis torosa TaxID=163714 RepID=A0A7R8ZS57_9CRUS|nr:unnamed protein product [Cyprideis torosa]CAG0895456.1 unnamed protein product [Cyprideis torosa]
MPLVSPAPPPVKQEAPPTPPRAPQLPPPQTPPKAPPVQQQEPPSQATEEVPATTAEQKGVMDTEASDFSSAMNVSQEMTSKERKKAKLMEMKQNAKKRPRPVDELTGHPVPKLRKYNPNEPLISPFFHLSRTPLTTRFWSRLRLALQSKLWHESNGPSLRPHLIHPAAFNLLRRALLGRERRQARRYPDNHTRPFPLAARALSTTMLACQRG